MSSSFVSFVWSLRMSALRALWGRAGRFHAGSCGGPAWGLLAASPTCRGASSSACARSPGPRQASEHRSGASCKTD
eukprot:13577484-Alexandrium_andersonii.AAC.1